MTIFNILFLLPQCLQVETMLEEYVEVYALLYSHVYVILCKYLLHELRVIP